MNSHVIDYEIFGDDLQFVEVELDRQETAVAIQTICWALTATKAAEFSASGSVSGIFHLAIL